jgi:hypothetical protein
MFLEDYQFSMYELTRLIYETKQIQKAVKEWRENENVRL